MATKRFIEKNMTNAATVANGAYWWGFAETTGAPTDLDLAECAPFKSLTFENNSAAVFTLILDPQPITNAKKWLVPNGRTLTIENKDGITFHQVVALSGGASTAAAGELKLQVRNY